MLALADIQAARQRIADYIHRTPVLTSRSLNRMADAQLYFKCENFQKIGAFKARGAHNAVLQLSAQQLSQGLVTHSSGNHAAALALAARNTGSRAFVIMPHNAPTPKIDSVRRLGGEITFCEPTLTAREAAATEVQERTGAALVHPFDNWHVMAGQGTAALELVEDQPNLDAILTPVGGGGLLSGTAVVGQAHGVRVFGAEPAGADDAQRSLRSGQLQTVGSPQTIADGLRTSLGQRPFEVISQQVEDIATVSDPEILEAMQLVWQILKIIIEPSCAVPVAVMLQRRLPLAGRRVGIILSGGNVDLSPHFA